MFLHLACLFNFEPTLLSTLLQLVKLLLNVECCLRGADGAAVRPLKSHLLQAHTYDIYLI